MHKPLFRYVWPPLSIRRDARLSGKLDCCEVFKDHSISLIKLLLTITHFFPLVISLSVYYLGFLLPHAMDARRQLDGIKRVGVVSWGI